MVRRPSATLSYRSRFSRVAHVLARGNEGEQSSSDLISEFETKTKKEEIVHAHVYVKAWPKNCSAEREGERERVRACVWLCAI